MVNSADDVPLSEYSPLTAGACKLLQSADYLAVRRWLSVWHRPFKPRSALTQEEAGSKDFTRRRARAIEFYVMAWLIAELILVVSSISFSLGPWFWWLAVCLASSRILEVVQVTMNAAIFDALSGRGDVRVASVERMIVLWAINFLELLLCFGLIYAVNYCALRGAGRPVTAYYFSVITQLTIGYGDVYPTGWLRVVAAVQALAGLSFVILVFARFLASLPTVRSVFDSRRT